VAKYKKSGDTPIFPDGYMIRVRNQGSFLPGLKRSIKMSAIIAPSGLRFEMQRILSRKLNVCGHAWSC
jgi:hypothetical protein